MTARSRAPESDAQRNGREQYLWEVLRTLWPPPARITRAGRMSRHRARDAEFLVCPDMRHAALLVPRRPLRAAAGALRRYKTSAGMRDRLRHRAMAVAAGTGVAEVLPDRIMIEGRSTGPDADILGYLRAVLGEETVVSIYIGPPRANRKPVLQALTRRGQLLAFVKVGVSPLTRELVSAEAAALTFLATVPMVHLLPPHVLHHGQWQGNEVLVQQALPASRPARGQAELNEAIAELSKIRGISHWPAAGSPYWRSLLSRLQALAQHERANPLIDVLSQLEPRAEAVRLAFGSWHGDWTPWNVTVARGRAMAWDWERFETGVPVGYDAVHYWMQNALICGRATARTAAEAGISAAAEILGPLGIDAGAAELVAMLYLVEIAVRYLHDGQAEAGAALGRIDTWLLPALIARTREFCRAASREA
jgi:hypothetical protein